MSELLAGLAIAEVFGWVWEQFGEEIVTSSTDTLKIPWKKFNLKRAAEQYAGKMKEQHNIMQIWRMTKPVPLEGIFTHVKMLSQPSALRHPSKHDLLEKVYLGQASLSDDSDKSKEERKDGLDIIQENQQVFILGKPGAGKTTFLKYLTLKALAGTIKYIPIFLPLGRFAEANMSILNFIIDQFTICNFPDPQSFIRTLLTNGKALVLCDGLDEVKKEEGVRKRLVQDLLEFSQTYGKCKFVITCRVAASESHFSGFTYVEMADFDGEQIQSFVTNWFKTVNPSLAEETTARFLKECRDTSNKRLWDLAKQPLLLTLLCLAYEETLRFPERRSEIYEEALDALLKKWDTSRTITRDEVYHRLSLGRKRQMFARIAAETFENGDYLFKQAQLEQKIVFYLQKLPGIDASEEIQADAIIQEIEARHGIFSKQARKLYSFSHLSFQEYYTAKNIVDNSHKGRLQQLIQQHCFDANWREVFLLTAEMLDDANEFFEVFLTKIHNTVKENERLRQLLTKVEQNASQSQSRTTPFQQRCMTLSLILEIGVLFKSASNCIFASTHASVSASAGNLAGSLANACACTLARALVLALDTEHDHDRDSAFGHAIDHTTVRLFSRVFDGAFDHTADYTITHLFSQASISAFGHFFDSNLDFNLDLDLAFNVAIARAHALFRSRVHPFPHPLFRDLAGLLAYSKEQSKHLRFRGLCRDLNGISVPSSEASQEEWEAVAERLFEIFQTYFSPEEYEFTVEQLNHVIKYLNATELLQSCLKTAYVSDRGAIEDQLLRVPQQT